MGRTATRATFEIYLSEAPTRRSAAEMIAAAYERLQIADKYRKRSAGLENYRTIDP
jgi:hypothetical protein